MNLKNFKPAIVYTIYIAATPKKVWEALAIKMAAPERMLAALKEMGIGTP